MTEILYYVKPGNNTHEGNVFAFKKLMYRYPWIEEKLFQPNTNAPWHLQAVFPQPDGTDEVLNFWPHVLKAYRIGHVSVQGYDAIRQLITQFIEDTTNPEPFDVIEEE